MEAIPTTPVTPRSRWRRRIGWTIALVVTPILLLLGYRELRQAQSRARLQAAIAVADADDPNWRLEQLRLEYEKRPVNTYLVEAMRAFPRKPVYRGWHGDDIVDRPGAAPYDLDRYPNGRMPELYLSILRVRLKDRAVEPMRLALLAMISSPPGRMGDYYKSASGLNSVRQLRNLANFQADEILLAIQEGRSDDALRGLDGLLRFCCVLDGCPSSIDQLVRIAIDALALRYVQVLLAHSLLTPEQLGRLQKTLLAHDRDDLFGLARVMRAELNDALERLAGNSDQREDFWKSHYPSPPPRASSWERLRVEVWSCIELQLFIQSLPETHAEVLEGLRAC